jgi:hypothetical protein
VPGSEKLFDALREFIVASLSPDQTRVLRKAIIASDKTLQRNERARYAPLEQLVADAAASKRSPTPDLPSDDLALLVARAPRRSRRHGRVLASGQSMYKPMTTVLTRTSGRSRCRC